MLVVLALLPALLVQVAHIGIGVSASPAPRSSELKTNSPVGGSSRTLDIAGVPYYISADPLVTLPSTDVLAPDTDVLLFSAFDGGAALEDTVLKWKKKDDVFAPAFLQAAFVQGIGKKGALSSASVIFLKKFGTKTLKLKTELKPGPYVLARAKNGVPAVFVPYRLHFDETQSFYKSITPRADGSFAPVSASLDTDSSPYIAVPSRVYAETPSKGKDLAGVRVTVKDIYRLKGLKTSGGNRHYYQLYPPQNRTGPAISRLAELGADLIGITKTVQFANGDRVTADWVDYHASFNPRGDGNGNPSGSSTGAGTSVSANDYVDVAIGSDTGGSVRGPAGSNGIYGIRPSVGAIDLENVIPLSDVLDTGGYLGRDPKLFAKFGKVWYAGSPAIAPFAGAAYPKTLYLAPEFANVSAPAAAIYGAFFTALGGFLNATASGYNISEAWAASSETDVPLTEFLNATYPVLVAYHQWTNVGVPFFRDYAAVNGGRNPHINPSVLARWRFGEAQGEEAYNTELGRRETFENWALSNFLKSDDQSCSDSFYLYPQNAGTNSTREAYFTGPATPPFGYSNGRIAVHSRSPDLVIPLGQIPWNSTISGVEEQLPVSVSVIARRGCDFMLLDLLDKLADAGIVKKVNTGRTAF